MMRVTITMSQAKALARWSAEAADPKGCSGYGTHFDAAMAVADEVREALGNDESTREPGWGHR